MTNGQKKLSKPTATASFEEYLKYYARRKGWSQSRLAVCARLNQSHINKIINGMTSSNLQNRYPPVLCVRQVAEILVVSHNTAYELVRSGAIHSVRVGRNYRIPLEAVIDYLSKH